MGLQGERRGSVGLQGERRGLVGNANGEGRKVADLGTGARKEEKRGQRS